MYPMDVKLNQFQTYSNVMAAAIPIQVQLQVHHIKHLNVIVAEQLIIKLCVDKLHSTAVESEGLRGDIFQRF